MNNLTTKELSALEDQLSLEEVIIKKYNNYASICGDPQLKNKCEQIALRHQAHYNSLLSYLK